MKAQTKGEAQQTTLPEEERAVWQKAESQAEKLRLAKCRQ